MSKNEVIEVSNEKMLEIIESYLPLGKFFTVEGNRYVGCDNETGDAWTEDFETKEECIKWLCG